MCKVREICLGSILKLDRAERHEEPGDESLPGICGLIREPV